MPLFGLCDGPWRKRRTTNSQSSDHEDRWNGWVGWLLLCLAPRPIDQQTLSLLTGSCMLYRREANDSLLPTRCEYGVCPVVKVVYDFVAHLNNRCHAWICHGWTTSEPKGTQVLCDLKRRWPNHMCMESIDSSQDWNCEHYKAPKQIYARLGTRPRPLCSSTRCHDPWNRSILAGSQVCRDKQGSRKAHEPRWTLQAINLARLFRRHLRLYLKRYDPGPPENWRGPPQRPHNWQGVVWRIVGLFQSGCL